MGDIKSGSEAAHEMGIALAILYNHIRAGRVVNRKAGGWPSGRGIEVDMDEVRAAVANSRTKSAGRAPRRTKAEKAVAHAIHDQLANDAELKQKIRKANSRGENAHAVRLSHYERSALVLCPLDPSHGVMFKMDKPHLDRIWHCAHTAHDGSSDRHVGGPTPQTRASFTDEEAHKDSLIGKMGLIMLELVYQGRTDLAGDLEAWLDEHEIEVWLPEHANA